MKAIIFQPTRSVMQAGLKKSKKWHLKFDDFSKSINRLTGWTSSCNTKQQVNLEFETKELAIEFAEKNQIEFEVQNPLEKVVKANIYANNFK